MRREPFAARLHFIPMALRGPQGRLVQLLRSYFEHAPGWVLLTTRGRKTGLPREVLLPCERAPGFLLVISTYGWRSHWLRNIQHDPKVEVSAAGWTISGRAEIVEDLERKRSLVAAHPFFPGAPFALVHAVLRTVLRPVLVFVLRLWVTHRPVVVVRADQLAHPTLASGSSPPALPRKASDTRDMTEAGIRGGCFCNAVRYRVTGRLQDARACHCSRCRKAFSGASSCYAELAPSASLEWISGRGDLATYETGAGFALAFCSRCGSTLCGLHDGVVHGLTLGCIDGDPGVEIERHIFVASKAPWDHIGGNAAQYPEHAGKGETPG